MSIVSAEVGIDVAKDELVVSIDGAKAFKIVNDEKSCLQLAKTLPAGSRIHLESSGGYERTVRRVLTGAGFEVRTHNPLKVRRLAQAQGKKAKTDPIDAQSLCGVGDILPYCPDKSDERRSLDLSRSIDALRNTATEYKMRAKSPELDKDAAKAYDKMAKTLLAEVARLEKIFQTRVKAQATAYKLALSVPAIGPKTARGCMSELPENVGKRTTAQIASYAGLAPMDDSSGKRNGPRHIRQGNSRLKACFYMPAICAIRHYEWARSLYARLMAKGRTHQGAIVAVMRRLLIRVVVVLQRGTPWVKELPKTAKVVSET